MENHSISCDRDNVLIVGIEWLLSSSGEIEWKNHSISTSPTFDFLGLIPTFPSPLISKTSPKITKYPSWVGPDEEQDSCLYRHESLYLHR
jgi:hypothetical protein